MTTLDRRVLARYCEVVTHPVWDSDPVFVDPCRAPPTTANGCQLEAGGTMAGKVCTRRGRKKRSECRRRRDRRSGTRCGHPLCERLELRGLLSASVVAVNPVGDVHTAPLGTNLSATFDLAIDPASVTDRTFVAHALQQGALLGPAVNSLGVSGTTITLDPAADLNPGERVLTTVSAGIESGGSPANPYVWQFRAATQGGTGTFNIGQFSGRSNQFSRNTALGDLDGDGDLDAFVVNRANQGNEVYLNQGHAQGGTQGIFLTSGQALGQPGQSDSFDVALGDLDADGDLDAFIANSGGQPNRVYINEGGAQGGVPGQFVDSGQALGSSWTRRVRLGDLDSDGDLDAFVANGSSDPNRIWVNQGGTQGGTPGVFADSGQAMGLVGSFGVSLGDLDSDGDLDAFVANSAVADEVWTNQGGAQAGTPGVFTRNEPRFGSSESFDVELGDVDGDGDLDAYVVAALTRHDQLWINQGGAQNGTPATFANSGQTLGNATAYGVALGDVDADGDLDAFVVSRVLQDSRLFINQGGLQGGTTGTFTDSGQAMAPNAASYGVELVDIDGDGDLDAFISAAGFNQTWLNQNITPRVTEVLASGTAWSAAFLDRLKNDGLGDGGLSIPAGSAAQLDALAWTNIDRVMIRFNRPVTIHVDDLELTGVRGPNGVEDGNDAYTFSQFGVSTLPDGQFEAVWTLDAPIAADKLRLTLDGSSPNSVRDLFGTTMDGDWTDTVSSYPSGNGVAGGDFVYRLNVLPGDLDHSGVVDSSDEQSVRAVFGSFTAFGNYVARNDVDGNGFIVSKDVLLTRARDGDTLPAASPAAAMTSSAPSVTLMAGVVTEPTGQSVSADAQTATTTSAPSTQGMTHAPSGVIAPAPTHQPITADDDTFDAIEATVEGAAAPPSATTSVSARARKIWLRRAMAAHAWRGMRAGSSPTPDQRGGTAPSRAAHIGRAVSAQDRGQLSLLTSFNQRKSQYRLRVFGP